MRSENSSSERTSDTTSASERDNSSKLTEAQFLEKQSELAKEAIARTLQHIKSGLKEGVNPVEWTREYPWTALGAAAVAGFVAATSMVPSKQQQALKKLAALERALHPHFAPATDTTEPSDKSAPQRSVLATFLTEAVKSLQPVLVSAITAKVSRADSKNGHSEEEPSPPQTPLAE